ncbi:hypothetical protein [Clostridium sp. D53t1_180928_C8]|uniref:hypothetical protein n=1 Tax=Clostridium sp. D53t1_180928_C8 TaxID=2787101 RepID=UPI0018A8E6A2|nr:hypothetical protein [Clostridium sp. D53t1_180928_C8]
MGLFNMFNKSKDKKTPMVEECFSETGDLLGEIIDLASRYTVDDNLLDKYSKDGLEIILINKARESLEDVLVNVGKSLDEYYNNEYNTVKNSTKENNKFSYSLDAFVALFNNSLDLYSENEEVRDNLNSCYKECTTELNNIKEILSDDKAIQDFTGVMPVVEEVEEVEEIIEEAEVTRKEDKTSEENDNEEKSIIIEDDCNSDVDGDLIINTDKMKVYFIRMSRNEEDEINLNLCIENKSDKEVLVEGKDISVDGNVTEPTFRCSISARSRVYDKMIFKNDIQQLINFEGTFVMIETNTEKVIDESKVSMFKED